MFLRRKFLEKIGWRSRLLLACAFFFISRVLVSAIVFDAASNSGSTNAGQSKIWWEHTVTSSGSNPILVVSEVVHSGSNSTWGSVTYDGVPMILGAGDGSLQTLQMWYLMGPDLHTGTHTVTVTCGSLDHTLVGAASFTGVSAIGVTSSASGVSSSNTITATIETSEDNSMLVGLLGIDLDSRGEVYNVVNMWPGMISDWVECPPFGLGGISGAWGVHKQAGLAGLTYQVGFWETPADKHQVQIMELRNGDNTPTNTPTATLTVTPTITRTFTRSSTMTRTPTRTLTFTITKTWTISPTSSVSPTQTISPTPTQSPTPTDSPTLTWTYSTTPTLSPTPSATGTPTQTLSPTPTWTPTPTSTHSPTPSSAGTPSSTVSPTTILTFTDSPSPSITLTSSSNATATSTPSATGSASASPTATRSSTPTTTQTPGALGALSPHLGITGEAQVYSFILSLNSASLVSSLSITLTAGAFELVGEGGIEPHMESGVSVNSSGNSVVVTFDPALMRDDDPNFFTVTFTARALQAGPFVWGAYLNGNPAYTVKAANWSSYSVLILSPTATISPTATESPSLTPTPSRTITPTPSATPTPSRTVTTTQTPGALGALSPHLGMSGESQVYTFLLSLNSASFVSSLSVTLTSGAFQLIGSAGLDADLAGARVDTYGNSVVVSFDPALMRDDDPNFVTVTFTALALQSGPFIWGAFLNGNPAYVVKAANYSNYGVLILTPTPTRTSTEVPTASKTTTPTSVSTGTFTEMDTATRTTVPTQTWTESKTMTPTYVSTGTFTEVDTATRTTVPTLVSTGTFTEVDTATRTTVPTLVSTGTFTTVDTATRTTVPTLVSTGTFTAVDTATRTTVPTLVSTGTFTAVDTATRTTVPTLVSTGTFTAV
ncbi:MAG: hypothetical protein V4498_08340, partial [candidate division FCPU426 bacterium]